MRLSPIVPFQSIQLHFWKEMQRAPRDPEGYSRPANHITTKARLMRCQTEVIFSGFVHAVSTPMRLGIEQREACVPPQFALPSSIVYNMPSL